MKQTNLKGAAPIDTVALVTYRCLKFARIDVLAVKAQLSLSVPLPLDPPLRQVLYHYYLLQMVNFCLGPKTCLFMHCRMHDGP